MIQFNQTGLSSFFRRDKSCFAVPPHPKLKKEMNILLDNLKEQQQDNYMFDQLTFIEEPKAGLDDGLIYPGTMFPLGTSMAPARAARSLQPPLRGILNILVVLVEFPDSSLTTPASHYEDLFFSEGVIPTGSVKEYYQEVTNRKISIQGNVVGPFLLPLASTTYANGASGMGNASPNARTMARDAAIAMASTINVTPYDNDHDGFVDAFIVIHAGTGAEVSNNPSQIWSHKWVIEGNAYAPPGSSVNIYSYLTVPEDCKLGVCAHELGHLLFGFPDLYDTKYKSEGVGAWCLMSGGSWNNNGDTPAHPSAWCKANQGWVIVETPKTNQENVQIEDVKTSFRIKKLWKNGMAQNEYFLLENRQLDKFDRYLPGGGLLVWHIDDSTADNTNPRHYKVGLVQADGNADLERNQNNGDNGDPYPGANNVQLLDKTTNPNTLSFGGIDSLVRVSNINANGSLITCNINVT